MLAGFLLFECLCVLVELKHGVPAFSLCEPGEPLGAMCERWVVQGRAGKAAPVLGASVPESLHLGLCQQPCLAAEKEGWRSGTASRGHLWAPRMPNLCKPHIKCSFSPRIGGGVVFS